MSMRGWLGIVAGLLGLASLSALVLDVWAFGVWLALPLAALALALLWASSVRGSPTRAAAGRAASGSGKLLHAGENEKGQEATWGRGASVLAIAGLLAALLVLCVYGLYAASCIVD
jgi:hypothetical protein